MIESFFDPARVSRIDYLVKYKPGVDRQFMFFLGIFIGALFSAVTSGSFRWQAVPDMWSQRFGGGWARHAAIAFMGGVVAVLGARLAGGGIRKAKALP